LKALDLIIDRLDHLLEECGHGVVVCLTCLGMCFDVVVTLCQKFLLSPLATGERDGNDIVGTTVAAKEKHGGYTWWATTKGEYIDGESERANAMDSKYVGLAVLVVKMLARASPSFLHVEAFAQTSKPINCRKLLGTTLLEGRRESYLWEETCLGSIR
jgi:hypothetical protein